MHIPKQKAERPLNRDSILNDVKSLINQGYQKKIAGKY